MSRSRSSRGLIAALVRRRHQVAAVALGALLLASAVAVVKPRDYRADTRLELTARESSDGTVVVEQVHDIVRDVLDRQSFAAIVTDLELAPEIEGEAESERIQRVEELVTELVGRTEATSESGGPNRWTITIAHTSDDPDLSLKLVEAIAERYQESTLRRPELLQEQEVANCEKQEAEARGKAERLGEQLGAFEEENAAFLEGPERRLEELRERITGVERDEIGAQQREIERLEAMLAEEPEEIDDGNGSKKSNPMYRSLQEAKLEAEGRIAGARRKLSVLRNSERDLLDEVRHSPEIRKQRDSLAADAEEARLFADDCVTALAAARARLDDIRGAQQLSFALPVPPERPDAPVGLGVLTLAGIGLLLGAGVGAGLAYALDSMDGSFRQADEVQRALGLPTLGAVNSIQTPAEVAAERSAQSKRVTGLLVMSVAALGLLTFALVGDAGAIHEFVRTKLG